MTRTPLTDISLVAHAPHSSGNVPVEFARRLEIALRAVVDAGRPHSGGYHQPAYPDGCECDQCLAWDAAHRILEGKE